MSNINNDGQKTKQFGMQCPNPECCSFDTKIIRVYKLLNEVVRIHKCKMCGGEFQTKEILIKSFKSKTNLE